MVELQFATVVEAHDKGEDCSWSSVVRGIERYAAYHSTQADDLYAWADLIEGIRQLREDARRSLR